MGRHKREGGPGVATAVGVLKVEHAVGGVVDADRLIAFAGPVSDKRNSPGEAEVDHLVSVATSIVIREVERGGCRVVDPCRLGNPVRLTVVGGVAVLRLKIEVAVVVDDGGAAIGVDPAGSGVVWEDVGALVTYFVCHWVADVIGILVEPSSNPRASRESARRAARANGRNRIGDSFEHLMR